MSSRWATSWTRSVARRPMLPLSSSRARSTMGPRWTFGVLESSSIHWSAARCLLMGRTWRQVDGGREGLSVCLVAFWSQCIPLYCTVWKSCSLKQNSGAEWGSYSLIEWPWKLFCSLGYFDSLNQIQGSSGPLMAQCVTCSHGILYWIWSRTVVSPPLLFFFSS